MHFSMYDFLHARHNFVSHTHSRMVEEREELGGSATMMDNTAQTTDANTQLTKRRLVVPYVKQDHGILRGTIACQSGVCSETSACCCSLHVFPVPRSLLIFVTILSRSTSKAATLILMSSTTTTCTTQKVNCVHAHSRRVSHDARHVISAYSLPFSCAVCGKAERKSLSIYATF